MDDHSEHDEHEIALNDPRLSDTTRAAVISSVRRWAREGIPSTVYNVCVPVDLEVGRRCVIINKRDAETL